MPLRPLHKDTGQPKSEKELSKDEVASRVIELEDDHRTAVARAYRAQADKTLLERDAARDQRR